MPKKSFRIKIIIPIVIVLVALVVTLNIFLSLRFSAIRDTLADEKHIANINSLYRYLATNEAASRAAAVSMAVNPAVIKAIKERNTNELLLLFSRVQDLYWVNYYTICDSEGVALARTHDPGNFGDSVLNQQNIQDAIAGKVATYFEEGTAVKVSVRTGSPVYDTDGTLIGVISAGIRFDSNSVVEELKDLFNAEVTIFLGDVRINTTITKDGRSIAGTTLEPDIAEIVINNRQEYSGNMEIFGEKYRTFFKPLINARGEAFAVFFLGNAETGMIAASNRSIREGIVLGLCGLAISIIVLIIIISSISKPITSLSADMDRIADGDLNVQIDVKSEDEVGHLARSFQKVADTMHKLLNDINVMIEEHERGNTDYSLQTEEFRGDYKNLALSVMRFSTFGMRDQLTGLPNRRSFENRLNWEWKQTIAKKSPISILIIDIDHFKKYGDSYGHPQGDLALKAISQKAMEAIRHPSDFIARREGDEIVVILPETESEAALAIAEKIRTEIKGMMIPCVELGALNITVSIGVSTQSPAPGRLVDDFISAADSALYKAKETGRDRVSFCGEADGQRTGV